MKRKTYIKVKGQWMHLSPSFVLRAVDSNEHTVEFMLSQARDGTAAKRFFREALRARHAVPPRVINVDRDPSYPKAMGKLRKKGRLPQGCELRPIKYLNNLRVRSAHARPPLYQTACEPMLGFWPFQTAWPTLQGYEATNQLRKGQIKGTTKDDIRGQLRPSSSGSCLQPLG
jgi:IS6 family transposase